MSTTPYRLVINADYINPEFNMEDANEENLLPDTGYIDFSSSNKLRRI